MEEKNYKGDDFYREAFSRNFGVFTLEEQDKIRNSKIAIAGMGGVGGHYLLSFVRLGVENFSIADFDCFEVANINRQAGADTTSLGRKKCDKMKEMAVNINPNVKIDIFPEGINEKNVKNFLFKADVVIDGLDFFSINDRLMLFRNARLKNIFAITSPPIGFGASLLVFDPSGMSFEKYFDINNTLENKEKIIRFAVGLSPAMLQRKYYKPEKIDFSSGKAPSLGVGPLACCVLVCAETIKIILGKKIKVVPFISQFDPFSQKYKKKYLCFGNQGIMQKIKLCYIKKIIKKSEEKN